MIDTDTTPEAQLERQRDLTAIALAKLRDYATAEGDLMQALGLGRYPKEFRHQFPAIAGAAEATMAAAKELDALHRSLTAAAEKARRENRAVDGPSLFEATWILDPAVGPAEAGASIGKYTSKVESRGGAVLERDNWGRRRLAYEINGKREGHYLTMRFQVAAEVAAEVEEAIKADETVIRSFVTAM